VRNLVLGVLDLAFSSAGAVLSTMINIATDGRWRGCVYRLVECVECRNSVLTTIQCDGFITAAVRLHGQRDRGNTYMYYTQRRSSDKYLIRRTTWPFVSATYRSRAVRSTALSGCKSVDASVHRLTKLHQTRVARSTFCEFT